MSASCTTPAPATCRLASRQIRRAKPRAGHSLLELIAASALLAATLVPGLRMIRDALAQSRRNGTVALITNLCVGKLEEHLCAAAATWAEGTYTGNFTADGYATVYFQVVRTDDPSGGGLADRLMAVTATVWDDTDGGGTLSSGEPRVVMASKVAKMAKYEDVAGS